MKKFKIIDIISIICSILGLVYSTYALILGLNSISSEGLYVIFIIPAIISIILILIDLLISLNKIKKGLIYSWIISIIKTCIVVGAIPNTIHEYKNELEYGVSNFDFYITMIALLIVITIPSIINIIKTNRVNN